MISIIICSRNPDISDELKQNIAKTIGVEYELVVIDNSKNNYSIFSAYNKGIEKTAFPLLCFMHEDVELFTQDWGIKVVEYFEKIDDLGILGVIGSHYLPNSLAYWHDFKPFYLSGIVPIQNNEKFEYVDYINKDIDKYTEVVAVDGMWFCMPKKLFDKIRFDAQGYDGFHMYDMDISMQVINILQKKVIVTFEIVVGHYTNGAIDEVFIKNMKYFYKKWEKYLPIHRNISIDEKLNEFMGWRMLEYYNLYERYFSLQRQLNSKAYNLGKRIINILRFLKR